MALDFSGQWGRLNCGRAFAEKKLSCCVCLCPCFFVMTKFFDFVDDRDHATMLTDYKRVSLRAYKTYANANREVERRHRHLDEFPRTIVYFLHVHKAGGSSVCSAARLLHGEVTTEKNSSHPWPFDLTKDHNCNLVWNGEGKLADARLYGSAADQLNVVKDLHEAGITFVANEFIFVPPGQMFTTGTRPWVYAAVVRDPFDLLLSMFMHEKDGKVPNVSDLVAFIQALNLQGSVVGKLVHVFSGIKVRKSRGEDSFESLFPLAVSRLAHFSAIVDTPDGWDRGLVVLRVRLGWSNAAASEVREGTRHGASMRNSEAYLASRTVRELLRLRHEEDLAFYDIARRLALMQFKEVTSA